MSRDYEIGMLWVEGPLSYVEVLCLQSFMDVGHHVKLYHYGEVENVPEGVEMVHGNEVLKVDTFLKHSGTGSVSLFSNVFRYYLLKNNSNIIWSDTDAYCVKMFTTQTGHFFGWESPDHINGGVLGLPPDSEALGRLLEMSEDEYAVPAWFTPKERDRLQKLKDEGTPVHVGNMRWGVWGPQAVTHHLQATGEANYALPVAALYPVRFGHRRHFMMARKRRMVEAAITPDTFSLHFYGSGVRQYLADKGGLPEPGSYLEMLLGKHKIDIAAAAITPSPAKRGWKSWLGLS